MAYLQISLKVNEGDRLAAAGVYQQYKQAFLDTIPGATMTRNHPVASAQYSSGVDRRILVPGCTTAPTPVAARPLRGPGQLRPVAHPRRKRRSIEGQAAPGPTTP